LKNFDQNSTEGTAVVEGVRPRIVLFSLCEMLRGNNWEVFELKFGREFKEDEERDEDVEKED